ncbi:MAG: SynChlorMet cassette protein ScmC [Pseudomonadota bacterium]
MTISRTSWRSHRELERAVPDSYLLHLNEGLSWNLTASEGTREWAARLARAVGLRSGYVGGRPTIRFIRGLPVPVSGGGRYRPSDDAELNRLAGEGWVFRTREYVRIWSLPGRTDLIFELLNTPLDHVEITMMRQAMQAVYEAVMISGGLPVHSALVEHEGTGFLLAGVGGSGKTTCCERLPNGWTHRADDEALVVRTTNGDPAVHPAPTWNSDRLKSGDGQWNIGAGLPLGGIFFLEKSSRDEALPLGRGEAAARINGSANQALRNRFHNLDSAMRREWRSRLFDNSCRLSRDVRSYVLRVTRTGRFWTVIEDAINGIAT